MPHLYVTLAEALIGFAVGNSFALLFGALFSQSRVIQKGIYPVIVGLQAVPILAIAPFILIWFGPGLIGKAVMAALICYFPATVISTDGLSRVNRDALALFDSLGASRSTIFWSLRLPAAFPAIISSLQVSATLCIVGAIVAELSGASKGVGYLIIRASYEFRTTMLFAVLTLVSLVTYGFFYLIQTLGRRLSRRFTFNYTSSVE
jgi:NitT/TauT family transport system permease protein